MRHFWGILDKVEWSAVKDSFSTYVCYALDGLFWLNLYYPRGLIDDFHCYTILVKCVPAFLGDVVIEVVGYL